MKRRGIILWRDDSGATAAEFTLVLPILIIFLLGIIDVGRFVWTWNMAEKATQMGVRYAVVTDLVSPGLTSHDFATGGVAAGDPIPESSFGGAECKLANMNDPSSALSCTCLPGKTCPTLGTADNSAAGPFAKIVDRMKTFEPLVRKNNVVVRYGYSGLGYAGDNGPGPQVAPLVTVTIRNLKFTPILFQLFGASMTLPDIGASLTLEDGAGDTSN